MKKLLFSFIAVLLPLMASADDPVEPTSNIVFADANVKALCVANWDTNTDGELSYTEAAAVTDLGYVFFGNTTITSFDELQYFTRLTSIVSYAFQNCSGLTSVTIPNSVTSIGIYAFRGCSDLTSITIGNNVTSIGAYAFQDCSGLTSITIPNSVTSIGGSAFYDCSGLTSITIGNNVTSIGGSAFYNCSGLTSVTIPNSVTSIGGYAFCGCSGLTSVHITDLGTWFNICFDGIYSNPLESAHHLFLNDTELKDLVIPNSVTSIGILAFSGCRGLTSVTIPNSVMSIGNYAFQDCRGLTSVTIPNSVTSIGNFAFQNCSGLTSITIPNSVTSISEYAFNGCSGLTSITIPNSVTSIGEWAFNGCSSLTSIDIPDNVTSINNNAFSGCSSLTSIDIPNNVTSINNNAFSSCSGLTSVIIPNSVTSIGGYAFYGCSGLTSITIPNCVTSIGEWAFNGCNSVTSVTIGSEVKYIKDNAFGNCKNLEHVYCLVEELSPTNNWGSGPLYTYTDAFYGTLIGFATLHVPASAKSDYESTEPWSNFGTIVTLPSSNIVFADANVKAICVTNWDTDSDGELSYTEAAAVTDLGTVFEDNTTITTFDELQYFTGLTSIGNSAFYGCTSLTSVTIPSGASTIDNGAFYGCSGLTSVTIPNNVTTIGTMAFYNCSGLTSMIIPDNVTSVGYEAFVNCSGLTSIEIGSGADFGSSPFINCGSLTSITVATGNTKYDSRNNCNAIIEKSSNKLILGSNNTVIPNSVTSIADWAFYNCSGLTSITIPEGVTSIGAQAFGNCSGLTSLNIPKSVTSIAIYNPFLGCSSLSSIIVDSDNNTYDSRDNCNAIIIKSSNTLISGCKNTIIPNTVVTIDDQAFHSNTGITSITIPESVKNINMVAFANCTNLTSITFTDGLLRIRAEAFAGCTSLTSVKIPSTVTTIGSGVFDDCTNLATVTVEIANPVTISASTFSNRTNATLYVPSGSEAAYSAADYWKEFKEIKAIKTFESVTITSAGMATYCSANDLDFTDVSGIKAYIASGFNPTTGVVFIMHVNEVPANTGIMLKGTPGTYSIPQKATNMYYVNMFKGTLSAMTVPATSDGYKNYVLGNGSQGLLFYGSNGGSTLDANRAYLQIPLSVLSSSPAPTRGFVRFSEDDATGIITPESMLQEDEGDFYNLNGQRVVSPKKGLYIKNGKKVIIR